MDRGEERVVSAPSSPLASQQAHDILRVIQAVGIADNPAAGVFAHLVLIDDPFQRRTIAQMVAETGFRNASQGQAFVHNHGAICLRLCANHWSL